jgi:hypothetical protein
MKIKILIILLFIIKLVVSQTHIINFDDIVANKSQRVRDGNNEVVFNFSYTGVDIVEVQTKQGFFNQLVVPKTYRSGTVGNPQLVSTYKLIEIPKNCKVHIEVLNYTEEEYNIADYFTDNKLIPYQPTHKKSIDTDSIPFVINRDEYKKDEYNNTEIAEFKILGNFRDKRIAKIIVNPVRYNPLRNRIRFYNNIEVKIIYDYTKSANYVNSKKLESIYFNSKKMGIESALPNNGAVKYTDIKTYPAKYLIITPSNYINSLQEFIQWKTESGFNVVIGNLDSIGAESSKIKSWIYNQYMASTQESPAPSFILLVGDIQQIPASQTGNSTNAVTDLYYASIDGDMFPDIYYGRLPAQDTTQLQQMLSKILMYEKYKFADDSFLDDATLIAGVDDEWNPRVGKPSVEYGTEFYFNSTNGFNNVNTYVSDYDGCYLDNKIGVGLISYTAHCSKTSWVNPSLTIDNIDNFTNNNKYPVAIGNCCLSCDFSIDECIGEAWMRKAEGGAVAYLGSVPNTYWWEDFYWIVGAHSPIYNSYPQNYQSGTGVYDAPFYYTSTTVSEMVCVGNMAVTQAHNACVIGDINSTYYWEAYHCLGDPSLMPYLTKGIDNAIYHYPVFQHNVNYFKVKATPNSFVALSNKNGLIGVAIANADSIAMVQTDTVSSMDSVKIVVTKYGFKPYINKIPTEETDGSFLITESIKIDDNTDGNGNGRLDFGEKCSLQIKLKNIGKKTARNINLSIMSADKYLKYISNNENIIIDSIKPDSTFVLSNKFNVEISGNVPDGYMIPFEFKLSDSLPNENRNYNNTQFSKRVDAPKLRVFPYSYVDDFSGNGNGILETDETAQLHLSVINTGHSQVSSTVLLSNISVDKSVNIDNDRIDLDTFNLNDTVYITYNISSNTIPVMDRDTLIVTMVSGEYVENSMLILTTKQQSAVQTGNEKIMIDGYPFNNYYKNNKTQILYHRTEIGEEIKALKSISFDISNYTSNVANRDLHNFNIRILSTSINNLNSAVSFDNAQLIYTTNEYLLPDTLGWINFELENPVILKDNRNIMLEVSWGDNNSFETAEVTSVNCSKTDFYSVIWGYSDNVYPATIDNSGYWRPNTKFEFDSVGIINITVTGDLPVYNRQFPYIKNCEVRIDTITQLSDKQGRTSFYFMEQTGSYDILLHSYGYRDTTVKLTKTQIYSNIDIELKRESQIHIVVKDVNDTPIANALVSIDTNKYYTNQYGEVYIYSSQINEYLKYNVEKDKYKTVTDSIYVDDIEEEQVVVLHNEYADLTIIISDNTSKLDSVKVELNNSTLYTDKNGKVIFEDLQEGKYTYTISKESYFTQTGEVTVTENDTVININMIIVDLSDKTLPIRLYPNPTKDVLYIHSINMLGADYSIINSTGQVVLKDIIKKDIQTIDLTNYPQGVYMLNIIENNKNISHTIILK